MEKKVFLRKFMQQNDKSMKDENSAELIVKLLKLNESKKCKEEIWGKVEKIFRLKAFSNNKLQFFFCVEFPASVIFHYSHFLFYFEKKANETKAVKR